jgi:hypothetical protein
VIAPVAVLVPSDGHDGDEFGACVDLDGDTIAVGASGYTFPTHRGKAYVYVKPAAGWTGLLTETASLVSSDGENNSLFGASVAIAGDTVFVGAPSHEVGSDFNHGQAYVFVRPAGGWAGTLTETATLTSSPGSGGEGFASALAASGDVVIAGNGGDTATPQGSIQHPAYVFVRPPAGWSGSLNQTASLVHSDGEGSSFGISVDIEGDLAIVGAPAHVVGQANSQGQAYMFGKPLGGWAGTLTETQVLRALDGAEGHSLGRSVAIESGTALAGAPAPLFESGSAYVFEDTAPPATTMILNPEIPNGQAGW